MLAIMLSLKAAILLLTIDNSSKKLNKITHNIYEIFPKWNISHSSATTSFARKYILLPVRL